MTVERGTSLKQVVETADVDLGTPCGGKGRCGKCKVVFRQGVPDPTPTESDRLDETELAQGYRLGCEAAVYEDAVVYVPSGDPATNILTVGTARIVPLHPYISKKSANVSPPTLDDLRSDLDRILDALETERSHAELNLSNLQRLGDDLRKSNFTVTGVFAGDDLIALEAGDTSADCYGVAFDIGTTTLAAYLLDLNTGQQAAVSSAMNPQARFGDDVISRISYATENADGLGKLQASVVGEMNKLLLDLCERVGVSPDRVYEASVVGNTCMTHLFLGIDPKHLAQAPYVPTVSQSLYIPAAEPGLNINPRGRVHVFPCIAGYVGADAVGMILASDLYEDDRLTLAVDIGTNGEIVLGRKGRMLACSTAAGPAFEGAHIKFGMRAAPGAIDGVWLDDGQLRFSVIGGTKAVGICGSGLLDAIVCLVQAGIIDLSGRIVDAAEVPQEFAHLRGRIQSSECGNDFMLAEGLLITQRDVREVQLAKGAIAAGIHTLMARMDVRADDLDRVILAGAFGNYVRKESAILAGMLPDVPTSKIHSIGNAAGEGAKLALISSDSREDADTIASTVEYVELTIDIGFQDRFADALTFGVGRI